MSDIKLTKRQKQLLQMLASGYGNREIAAQLDLTESTVKVHFFRLFKIIGVQHRGQALKWWNDNRPDSELFALREAFNVACNLWHQLMADPTKVNTAEFEKCRANVLKIQGEQTC